MPHPWITGPFTAGVTTLDFYNAAQSRSPPMEAPDMKPAPQHDAEAGVPATVHAGRRRLLRGGLATAPVLLSLTSRPVTATTTCTPASSHASINLSRPDTMYSCGGKKPTWWKDQTSWPSGYRRTTSGAGAATTFNNVFGSSGYSSSTTLLQVLQSSSTAARDRLARSCVAAVLNAAAGHTNGTVLSVATVKTMWSSVVSRGYYEPTAGIKWYETYSVPSSPTAGLIAWMDTTMPAG